MRSLLPYLLVWAVGCGPASGVHAEGPLNQTRTSGMLQPAFRTQSEDPSRDLSTETSLLVSTWMGERSSWDLLEASGAEEYVPCQATCSRWWVQADALFWDRIGDGCDQVLAVDLNSGVPGEDTVLSTSNLEFSMEPGARVLVGYRPDPCGAVGCCSALEFSYFGVYGWEDSAAAVGAGNLAIPGILGLASNNFFLADEIRAVYRSQLNNVEANCIKSCCTNCYTQIDFISGFRFIALNEDFSLIGTDVQEGTSSYDITTSNYLYGLQLGGRARRQMQNWAIQLTGKAGIFVNDASQSQIVTDDPPNPDDYVRREVPGVSGTSAAMLGEIDITLVRRITNIWSARVGYSVMGLGGLALAPNQLDFNDTFASGTSLSTNGFVLFHGAHAGLEAVW